MLAAASGFQRSWQCAVLLKRHSALIFIYSSGSLYVIKWKAKASF